MGKVKSKQYGEKKSGLRTESCCAEKQPYIRYAVIEFTNKTFGVLDKDRYHIVSHQNGFHTYDRNDHQYVIELCQTTLPIAKKLAKKLNKQVKDVTFTEIN